MFENSKLHKIASLGILNCIKVWKFSLNCTLNETPSELLKGFKLGKMFSCA